MLTDKDKEHVGLRYGPEVRIDLIEVRWLLADVDCAEMQMPKMAKSWKVEWHG